MVDALGAFFRKFRKKKKPKKGGMGRLLKYLKLMFQVKFSSSLLRK
jgi:hypothetical protein